MPGESTVNFNLLHRTCKLVVLLCLLHISVTVVFYVRSLDIRFSFVQNQQSRGPVTPLNYVGKTEPKAGAEVTADVQSELEPEREDEPELQPGATTETTQQPAKKLTKCPETSPLLGKTNLIPGYGFCHFTLDT